MQFMPDETFSISNAIKLDIKLTRHILVIELLLSYYWNLKNHYTTELSTVERGGGGGGGK